MWTKGKRDDTEIASLMKNAEEFGEICHGIIENESSSLTQEFESFDVFLLKRNFRSFWNFVNYKMEVERNNLPCRISKPFAQHRSTFHDHLDVWHNLQLPKRVNK
jgi:hypothetical protein